MRTHLFMIFIIVSLFCSFGVTGSCENLVEYRDEYVSFEYDADFLSSIDYYDSDSMNRLGGYYFNTSMNKEDELIAPNMSISIINTHKGVELYGSVDEIKSHFNEDWENNGFKFEVVAENEVHAIPKKEGSSEHYAKLLYLDDETYITALYYLKDGYEEQVEFLKHIYESVKVNDRYGPGSYIAPDEGFYHKDIYKNVVISEQMVNYAKEAIRISEAYLSFEIDGDEAKSRISKLHDRAEAYEESSDMIYDDDIVQEIFFAEFDFWGDSDEDLIEMITNLKRICHIEELTQEQEY